MQEIKFRGLPIEDAECADTGEIVFKKDEFVYGNLIVDGNKRWIVGGVAETDPEYIDLEFWCKVRPETVGQYTGFKDKNGVKIWEGDIVEAWSQGVKAIGVVQQRIDGLWLMFPAWQGNKFWGLCPDHKGRTTVKITGNRWDNPELLEAK